ncbi:MAG TPA: hypothetical protein VL651_08905 [Bacteroidia bacterium]|jgi:hypothetical protein|nr:hypothetical protein [Bacteroidia bacterium]
MKKIFFLAAVTSALVWTACSGDKPATTEDVVPAGMVAKDLKDQGLPLKINIPDSTNGAATITETPTGVEVTVGAHFDILINSASAEESDITKYKPILEAADELPKTFTQPDSATLRWEVNLGSAPMCHFYHTVKIGTTTYYVRDNNNSAEPFKAAEIDKMLNSAKSLRERPVDAPKS